MNAAKRGPGRPPSEKLRERRQEEILDAAAHFFAEQGFADADLQVLADRLNVGKGTIYRYFPSKDILFLAAVERSMKLLRAHLDERLVNYPDPVDQIREGIRVFFRFYAENPHFVELFIQERACFREKRKTNFLNFRNEAMKPWHEYYRAMMQEGRVRTMPIIPLVDAVSYIPYGIMFMNFVIGEETDPDQQAELVAEVILRGILTREHQDKLFPPGAQGKPPAAAT